MLKAKYIRHDLIFNIPGGTSRGVLKEKPSWYLRIEDEDGHIGLGEISIIPGLSPDEWHVMDHTLEEVCMDINVVVQDYHTRFLHQPAIRFGIEMCLLDIAQSKSQVLFPSDFCQGQESIKINGLIWMGDPDFMNQQIENKLNQGYSCLKMKIGAINFEDELKILKSIRKRYSKEVLELRVDANGAFSVEDALSKMKMLSKQGIHSIEQPIKAGQWTEMSSLCSNTELPIALDEELIGVHDLKLKQQLMDEIDPQYIILKPSLTGGFMSSEEWINIANDKQIAWWVTSALEGNIGLSAIAQWTYRLNSTLPQGLGTGQVFSNNIHSPLYLKGDQLYYNPEIDWQNPFKVHM